MGKNFQVSFCMRRKAWAAPCDQQCLKSPASSWGHSQLSILPGGHCLWASVLPRVLLSSHYQSLRWGKKKVKPLCHSPGLGRKPSHTQPTCCCMPGLSLLPLRCPWGHDVPWGPGPVYYFLSAPACFSPFLGWCSALC